MKTDLIVQAWNKFSKFPGGRYLFNKFFARMVPYTGTIYPEVLELGPGHSKVLIRDRKIIRNHLNSIHAAALMNFAEAASGIAFISGLPPKSKGIVTAFHMEYLKKARGTLTAECDVPCPTSNVDAEYTVEVELKNEAKEVVARGKAQWRVGPEK